MTASHQAREKKTVLPASQHVNGRPLQKWIDLLLTQKTKERKQLAAWLQLRHNLTPKQVHLIVDAYLAQVQKDIDATALDRHFSSEKLFLKPVVECLLRQCSAWKDVHIRINKTYISLVRNRPFCTLKVTQNGLKVGLPLEARPLVKKNSVPMRPCNRQGRMVYQATLLGVDDVNDTLLKTLRCCYKKS